MMKRIFLIAVIGLCAFTCDAQISVGGQIGVNFGMGKSGKGSIAPTNSPKSGLILGVLADLPIVEKLSFRPEFNFVQKGSKYGGASYLGGPTSSTKVTLSYIELPLNVVYKMTMSNSPHKLYFGLGPAFGFGITGNQKNSSGKTDIKFNGNPDQLKRVDVGLNLLAGYQFEQGFFGKVGYTLGFANIDPDQNDSYKNRGFNICVGYMVRGKKK